MVTTRFCPTPDGFLHHGNLYVAILNQEFASRCGGRFEVQIDDLVSPFPPEEIIEGIIEDLEWFGLCKRDKVRLHSRNKAAYLEMLDSLEEKGWLRIRRAVQGCCLARVEIFEGDKVLEPKRARASSCAKGVAGWLPFASDPRHLLAEGGISVVSGALGWRHDKYWISAPEDEEPWVELELSEECRPTAVQLSWWQPAPLEAEVQIETDGGHWKRAAHVVHEPQRTPGYHLAWFIPQPQAGAEEIGLDCGGGRSTRKLRLKFKGMQPIEGYEICAPAQEEVIHYEDLCNGRRTAKRTVAAELRMYQFGRAASDAVLGTTHVIRGNELMKELDLYVQCYHALERPLPVLCHVPPLVNDEGEKLSKSEGNAPRIANELRAKKMSPEEARRWIIESAYKNVKQPMRMHNFEVQMAMLRASVDATRREQVSRAETESERLEIGGGSTL